MNVQLSEEQSLLRDSFARVFARESSIERVRKVLDNGGFDPALWAALVESGLPIARIAPEDGGLGLPLLDTALIAEEAGRFLAPAPVVETMVAARLISIAGPDAAEWIGRIAAGAVVSFCPAPARDGVAGFVPGGAIADAVVAWDEDELVLASGSDRAAPQTNLGLLPIASWRLGKKGEPRAERIVLFTGDSARDAFEAAVCEWKILTAAFLGGLARKALEAAASYACNRHQFGWPVGSFQGLSHPLADAVTAVEGGQLLVWKAISAIAEGEADAAAMPSLCWWWMRQAAGDALGKAIRTLGGYGLSLEYDLQLYHRVGTAVALLGGDPDRELAVAAERLFGESAGALPDAGQTTISFAFSPDANRHVSRLNSFFEAHWNERMRGKAHHSTASHDAELHRGLAGQDLIFGDWPRELGGVGHGAEERFATTLVFEDWNYTSHVLALTGMVARLLMQFGSEETKAEILPRMKAGEAVCSLGFSEPEAGSDVFAARTSAVRTGDAWTINGQKIFTTGGHFADYVLLLTRTAAGPAKHHGLTLFIVPTALPGYAHQPVYTYQDERTNITFYADMQVPDRYRIGEIDSGAAIMGTALTLEHGGGNYFSGHRRVWRNALAWASEPGSFGRRPLDDPAVRRRLAQIRARQEVAEALVVRGLSPTDGPAPRHWGPMGKLFVTESFRQNCRDILDMAGAEAILCGDHPLGTIELDHRRAYGTTIYGGTSEIHRSLVAEQALGLPKSRS
jgi:3-oxochol-4-en-24-oyl-CoA dehydrogenase